MAAAHVARSRSASGKVSYLVRYRLVPGEAPRHVASWARKKDAEACAAWATSELAAGRIPDWRAHLASLAPPRRRRLDEAGREWLEGRLDLPEGTGTRPTYNAALRRLGPLAGRDPAAVTLEDVQAWVAWLAEGDADHRPLVAKSIRAYLGVLRQVLDHAGRLQPDNPARDRRLRVPRVRAPEVHPPSRAHVAAILRHIPPRWRLAVRVLEATGMRVGELVALTWGDVESRRGRWLVRQGKTNAARRWVAPPADLFDEVDALLPREDRVPDRRVFRGVTEEGLRGAMGRACLAAGVPHYHPHDLRHRFVSLLVRRGMSIPEVARLAGHVDKNITLSVYAHVLLDEEETDG